MTNTERQPLDTPRIHYMNASGMRGKINDFYAALSADCYDIVVVTETWLLPDHTNSEIAPDSWSVFRRDRYHDSSDTRVGGGMMKAARNTLRPVLVSSVSNQTELVWVITTLKDRSIFIGAAYIPPGAETSTYEACCNETDLSLSSMRQTDDAIFLGDFNIPGISWVEDTDLPGTFIPVDLSSQAEILVDRLFTQGFIQANQCSNDFGNVLDLCFFIIF